jgi:cell division protein ZapA
MAQVDVMIGGRKFAISCQDGEQAHLQTIAAIADAKSRGAGDPLTMTESRMLLFTALFLADELHNLQQEAAARPPVQTEMPMMVPSPSPSLSPQQSAAADHAQPAEWIKAIDALAARAETIAQMLEKS